jgi:adenylate kinase family enzyme
MQRVLVGGISGAGKSTMARTIAARLQLPYIEMDALFHGPGWVRRPEYDADLDRIAAGERWVIDSDGTSTGRDDLWVRADTLVWMDLPRWQVMPRVVRRSLWRGLRRTELWNGNRESLREWRDPEHPVQWAWRRHAERRARIAARVAQPTWGELDVVHLRSAAEARRWIRTLSGQAS